MLHELVQYAKDQGLSAEPGFNAKQVRWLLIFDEQGRWTEVQDLSGETKGKVKSKGVLFSKCPDLSQPEMIAAGKGTRHFLVDALDKVVLLTKDGEVTPKLASEHDYFVNLLRQASPDYAVLAHIADTLSDETQLQAIRQHLAESKAKPTDSATLAVANSQTGKVTTIVRENWWHDWWRAYRQQLLADRQAKTSKSTKAKADSEHDMLCFITGEPGTPAATHPKINSLSDVGGLATGDALLSFNKDAFTSFDLDQGQNAAISEDMAATYASALNDLLRTHCHRLSNVKIVYWYAGADIPVGSHEDMVHCTFKLDGLVDEEDEQQDAIDSPSANEVNTQYGVASKLVQAINSGERPDLVQARFYTLMLSANSGRVVIRDWQQGSFFDLANAIKKWFDDLSIISRDGQNIIRSHKFMALIGACVRDLKDAPASLQLSLWKAVLHPSRAIPDAVIAQVLTRIRIDIINDQSSRHARFALLKAYLIRKGYPMTEELNECSNETGLPVRPTPGTTGCHSIQSAR